VEVVQDHQLQVNQELKEAVLHFSQSPQQEEVLQKHLQMLEELEDQVVEVLLTQVQVEQVIHHLQIPLKETLVEIL
tara:strand:- start:293 stop:520 length:228 start_codon:yes stop_codon:yes gene_type:complete